MLSSTTEHTNLSNNLHRVSSSSSSSPPQFASSLNKPKTMEEVWKDINLASLNDHSCADQDLSLTPSLHNPSPPPPPPHTHHHHSNSNNFTFQDFFSCRDQPTRLVLSSASSSSSTTPTSTCTLAPTATILSLNSGLAGFDFLDNSHLQNHHNSSNSNVCTFISSPPFDGFDSLGCFGKRRIQDSDDSSSCDRRHQRMIKNRESAARSRARKQAYTQELLNELEQLRDENIRLKREQEELYLAAASQLPKKCTLQRTSTAPF